MHIPYPTPVSRRVREFNDCNRSSDGRFGANNDPECGPGKAEPLKAKAGARPAGGAGVQRTADLADAISRILRGEVVELDDLSSVNTILTKLAAIAKDAMDKGEKAPNYDLCNVSVRGSNLFCADKLRTPEYPNGIPRLEMPQMGGKPVPGSEADKLPRDGHNVDGTAQFIAHMQRRGIEMREESVLAASLKASQSELVGPKVAGMMVSGKDLLKTAVFISRDNYIVDGHHRWAAIVGRDSEDGTLNINMPVIRVDAPISEVLHLANAWAREFGIAGAAGPQAKAKAKEAAFHESQKQMAKRFGLTKFDFASAERGIKSVGFSPSQRKWYGWSHRAVAGFGVGDRIAKGDVVALAPSTPFPAGTKIRTMTQAKRAASVFANEVA